MLHDEEEIDRILSIILEYGEESTLTIHRVSEYGKQIRKSMRLKRFAIIFLLKRRPISVV